MVALAIPFVLPFIFLATVAFRTREDYISSPVGIPQSLTLDHMAKAWDAGGLGQAMINSVVVCTVSAIGLVVICSLASYWFLRHRGGAARLLFWIMIGVWVIPFVIYVIPLYVALSDLGLTDNLLVLGVVYAGVNAPFGLYLMDSYMRAGIPNEVREAARIDGATSFQEFTRIVLPLARPVIGTLAALGFIWTWGDLLLALVMLPSSWNYTLTLAAATLAKSGEIGGPNPIQVSAAAALISVVPLACVFLVAQRAISRGMTAGFGK
jgi:ABC-type glycerol-3-phosphate transport system permease component